MYTVSREEEEQCSEVCALNRIEPAQSCAELSFCCSSSLFLLSVAHILNLHTTHLPTVLYQPLLHRLKLEDCVGRFEILAVWSAIFLPSHHFLSEEVLYPNRECRNSFVFSLGPVPRGQNFRSQIIEFLKIEVGGGCKRR